MPERNDSLKCLSIGSVYQLLQYLSKRAGLSVSAWIRTIAIREYSKEKKKELATAE